MSLPATLPTNRAFTRAAYAAGLVTSAMGSAGVAGWLLDMPALQNFGYGVATMKMNTAVSLLLGGLALTLTAEQPATRARSTVARGFGLLLALVGAVTLAEYFTGHDLGIDQLLMAAPRQPDGASPGRMAPNTALCFALIGTALLLFDSPRRAARTAAQVACLFVLMIGFLALSGYLLSVDALYGVSGYTSVALPTAVALTLLATGVVVSRPDRGVVAILAQANPAGAAIRRLLPLIVGIPLLLAWLERAAVDAAWIGADFGAASMATLSVCLLSALAIANARNQGRWESERTRLDDQIRLAMESTPNGMIIVDDAGKILLANAAIERLFGYPRAELIGCTVEKLVPDASRRNHERLRADYQSEPMARAMAPAIRVLHGSRKDGGVVPVEVSLNPMRMPHGNFVLATVLDMQNREQLERAAERERFFQLSVDALSISNTSGYFVQVNPAFERILGYTRDELLAVPYLSFVHPDDLPASAREAQKARTGESVIDFRNRYRAKDGAYRWLQWRAIPDRTGQFYATARDITRELEAANALQASFKERGVLLQEVHHRVKNNLQIIVSMINMQVRKLRTGVARDALEECGSRVQAIGLIHETLYQAKDFARIPIRDYALSLVDNIFGAMAGSPAMVSRELDIAPVLLTVEKAIPCGLIINELTTNALKHAFPGDRRGTFRVSLRERDDRQLTLTVADDGVGLDPGFEIESSGSMGLTLVATLVEQLKGRLTIVRSPGATFEITFPLDANP